ncbi:TetR/AcrR family transcriptional regulator [Streptomyces humi]|uniref:TetR/AcrR family transcriptional regulator n=1 Tax=Streptomyces humi TaxID=1428620 RepID=UPI0019CF4EB9|nr:TetR/AcrR family transcriptional regulator [Streptomyces humi]
MRPVTRRQSDHHAARSAATRALVTSALKRLLDSGAVFSEITVQRLLEEAGVSRATFYAHFRSKSDVLVRLTDDLRDSLLELARHWDPAGDDGADRLARFFAQVIIIHRAHQYLLTAVREAASYDTSMNDFYTADLEGFDEHVLRTLHAQQADGSTPAAVDATVASRVIVWGGSQAIARHIAVDDGGGDEVFAHELAQIWWHGAYRRPVG